MSDSTNPIFDSEREFLERQKEEYKNALLGNVEEIKDKSQRIGKKALLAGGALVGLYGMYRLTKMIRSNTGSNDNPYYLSEKKAQRIKSGRTKGSYDYVGSYEEEGEDDYDHSHSRNGNGNTSLSKSFAQSDLFKMISSQVSALILVILTRKLEEYMGGNAFGTVSKEPEPEAETSVVFIEDATTIEPDTTFPDKDVR
jgi:hypothetical protein